MELNSLIKRTKGLTAFQIKVIALVVMTMDHIAAFGFEIPIVSRYSGYLRMIGRLAAPLFLFLLVQSIHHTRSKQKFLLRLYIAGLCVGLFITAMNVCLGEVFTYFTPGNIIFTFFYTALYVVLIEQVVSAWAARSWRTLMLSICLIAASFVPTILSLQDVLYRFIMPSNASARIIFLVTGLYDSLLPSFMSIQYGIGLVLLGVLMYFAKSKNRQCFVFATFCVICIVGTFVAPTGLDMIQSFGFFQTFFDRFQCYMIFALPIMFLYNGEAGRKCKWFFYVYYPLHRELIFIIAHLIAPG